MRQDPSTAGHRRRGPFLAGALLLLGLLAGRGEAEEGLDARWTSLRQEAVTRLHDVARAFASAKLFGTRAKILEVILEMDPEDAVARKWLRYRRGPDGWTRPVAYKPPRNRRPPRPDLEARRCDWSRWFGDAAAELALEAVAKHRFDLHRTIVDEVIPLAPDHAMLRMANGEVRTGKGGASALGHRWVLKETWSALRRRPALRDVARRSVDQPPPCRKGRVDAAGEPLDAIEATAVLQSDHVRVLGIAPGAELRSHVARLEATWPLFETAFGLEAPTWTSDMDHATGLSVYVFADPKAGNDWLQTLPDASEAFRAFAAPLASVMIPARTAILTKATEGGLRLEAAVKLVLDSMCITELGITGDQAWISEGLNHYLSWPINGTRLIGTVGPTAGRYAPQALGPKTPLPTALPGDDWLAAGAGLLESEQKPDFHLMVGKKLNALTAEEILYGYCIAAFLLEGRPSACVPFLKAVGASAVVDVEPKLVEHLGLDVPAFEHRLVRWLKETTSMSLAGE